MAIIGGVTLGELPPEPQSALRDEPEERDALLDPEALAPQPLALPCQAPHLDRDHDDNDVFEGDASQAAAVAEQAQMAAANAAAAASLEDPAMLGRIAEFLTAQAGREQESHVADTAAGELDDEDDNEVLPMLVLLSNRFAF